MLGNFSYCNPCKLYFGDKSLDYLKTELPKYGKNVVLIYGGGSIKKNGVYEEVIAALEKAGKTIIEFPGIMENPTYKKVLEGTKLVKEKQVDWILAVGGGSVMDCCKAISIAARCDGCIGAHVAAALKAGASKQELVETIDVAVLMGGGPAVIYGTQALAAVEELAG